MILRHLKFGSALMVAMLLSMSAATPWAAAQNSPPLAPPAEPGVLPTAPVENAVEQPPAPPKTATITDANGGLIGGEITEDTGIVRITDHPNGLPNSVNSSTCEGSGRCAAHGRSNCPSCPNCQPCEHGYTRGTCPHGCKPSFLTMAQYRRKYGTVYSQDYGWAPPGMHPMEWTSVSYNRYFPGQWTGQTAYGPAVVRPHVYYPTDTTQQGYYYQHAPAWIPVNGMVPPVPNPNDWHQPLCQGCGYNGANGGYCRTCQNGQTVAPEQVGTPVPETTLPATPAANLPLNRSQGTPALLPVTQ
ncbi:MAG: hypothetical protein R3C01_14840 [Planctomycetaceae bacterium]